MELHRFYVEFIQISLAIKELIMNGITTTSISILFNRGKMDNFRPLRGLREGDPLSPYIFILCLEYLGFLI